MLFFPSFLRSKPSASITLCYETLLSRPLLLQSWTALLDAHSYSRHRWSFYFLALATPRRHPLSRSPSRFLPSYLLLSRLGRHLFLWQSLFCFSHPAFHSRPRRFLRSRRQILSLPARC